MCAYITKLDAECDTLSLALAVCFFEHLSGDLILRN